MKRLSRRMSGARACALALLIPLPLVASATEAPARPAFSLRVEPARPLPLPTPIALGAPATSAPFQWTGMNREQLLRNVVTATMYAVRPAAGKGNGRAVLVVPGGGYMFVAIDNEGLPVAQRLAEQGYTAFVLVYRVKPTPPADADFEAWLQKDIAERFSKPPVPGAPELEFQPAVDDARAAMRWLREHAGEFGVNPAQIGFIGFSAGARTGQRLVEQAEASQMPANLALIYGGLSAAKPKAPVPPLFAAQAADDPLFPVTGIDLLHSWRQAGQRAELHLYEKGGHGFGLRNLRGTTADGWMDAYLAWLAKQ
jgi:acetyl esterase/lipase